MEHTNHHNHHQQQQQLGDQDSLGYPHPPPPLPPPPPPLRVSAFSKPSPPPPLPPRNENDNRNSSMASDPPVPPVTPSNLKPVKYKECLRNHAAAIGGYVLDGCGEFMAADVADGNTVNSTSMKCAACGCHRSFHQKEPGQGENYYRRDQPIPLLLPPPPPPTNQQRHFGFPNSNYKHVMIPPSPSGFPNNNSGSGATTESSSEERKDWQQQQQQQQTMAGMASSAVVVSRKRHRTKFSQEQKERMMEFAERVGWRFQKQDEAAIEEICREVGVRRHVLKVWMHNNKHSIKKQQQQQQQEGYHTDQLQAQLQHNL